MIENSFPFSGKKIWGNSHDDQFLLLWHSQEKNGERLFEGSSSFTYFNNLGTKLCYLWRGSK